MAPAGLRTARAPASTRPEAGWCGTPRPRCTPGISWSTCHTSTLRSPRSHSLTEVFRLHGLQLISWNLFVLAGLVMFGVLMAWAARAWRASYLSRSPISSVR